MKGALSFVLATALLASMSPSSPPAAVRALSQSVVVVGLNAALQKRFVLSPGANLEPGNVHRAHEVESGVGGKGQDVAVALSCLLSTDERRRDASSDDDDDRVLLAQFLGAGPEGDAVRDALRTKRDLSDALTVRNAAPLRTCTTIVGADEATELVETSGDVTEREVDELFGKIERLTKEGGKVDCLCVMGSMPPGCAEDTYAKLTTSLAGKRSLVLIDSVVGLDPLLGALARVYDEGDGSEKRGGAVLKLNAAELCKLAGAAKSEAAQVTTEELKRSTEGFVSKYANAISALDYLCVTDGKWPGYVVELPESTESDDFRAWKLPAADLSDRGTLYPIGAGDTVAAGTLAAWQYLHHQTKAEGGEGSFFGVVPSKIGKSLSDRKAESPAESMATAFAFGLACGSASCLQEENSVFDVDDAMKFFEGMDRPVLE
ncbi:hypothetical protein ACHAWF_001616 [Thalassiosira exigua]